MEGNGTGPAIFALAGAIVAALSGILGAWLRGITEARRIDKVEAPASAADAWAAVFEVTHRTMLDLRADVQRLEQRLNDQDEEHRLEIVEHERLLTNRELAVQHCEDALRRLRSYVSVVTDLLVKHNIPFPPMIDEPVAIAPERRAAQPGVTVMVDSEREPSED